MKIHGANAIAKALDKLPDELKKGGERRVLAAGAKPIVKAARGKVRKDSGNLKKSLGSKVKMIKGVRTARVGARTGFGKMVERDGRMVYSKPTNYAHLVEYGTSRTAAKPFIRPAVDNTKNEVVQAMSEGLSKHLTSAVKRVKARRRRR